MKTALFVSGIMFVIITIACLMLDWPSIWTIALLFSFLAFQLKKEIRKNEDKDPEKQKTIAAILKKTIWKWWVVLWLGIWFIIVFLRKT